MEELLYHICIGNYKIIDDNTIMIPNPVLAHQTLPLNNHHYEDMIGSSVMREEIHCYYETYNFLKFPHDVMSIILKYHLQKVLSQHYIPIKNYGCLSTCIFQERGHVYYQTTHIQDNNKYFCRKRYNSMDDLIGAVNLILKYAGDNVGKMQNIKGYNIFFKGILSTYYSYGLGWEEYPKIIDSGYDNFSRVDSIVIRFAEEE